MDIIWWQLCLFNHLLVCHQVYWPVCLGCGISWRYIITDKWQLWPGVGFCLSKLFAHQSACLPTCLVCLHVFQYPISTRHSDVKWTKLFCMLLQFAFCWSLRCGVMWTWVMKRRLRCMHVTSKVWVKLNILWSACIWWGNFVRVS